MSKAKDEYYKSLESEGTDFNFPDKAQKYILELERKLKKADENIESLHNAIRYDFD